MRTNFACAVGGFNFFERAKHHVVALGVGHVHRKVVTAHHDVLRRADNRRSVRWAEDIVGTHHQCMRFNLGLDRQRQVNRHLVTVEISIEAFAHERMQRDGVALDQSRLKSLNTHTVQSGGTI